MATLTVYELAGYNSGELRPVTIDLALCSSMSDVHDALHDGLQALGGEEWIIADYEGVPAALQGDTYTLFSDADLAGQWLADGAKDDDVTAVCVAYALDMGGTLDDARDALVSDGDIRTDRELGEHFADESDLLGGVPDYVARYFDYEAYGRDLRLGGDVTFYDVGGRRYCFMGY